MTPATFSRCFIKPVESQSAGRQAGWAREGKAQWGWTLAWHRGVHGALLITCSSTAEHQMSRLAEKQSLASSRRSWCQGTVLA